MTSILKSRKRQYDMLLDYIREIETKSDLEYCILKLQQIYMKTRKCNGSNLSDVVSVTINAGIEFKRRYLNKKSKLSSKIMGG